MNKRLVQTRILSALGISGTLSRAKLQDYLNGDVYKLEPDIKKTALLGCIKEMLEDKRLVRIGHGSKVTYKIYEEPEIKESKLWRTPPFKRPNPAKIWHDLWAKVPVINGFACGGDKE